MIHSDNQNDSHYIKIGHNKNYKINEPKPQLKFECDLHFISWFLPVSVLYVYTNQTLTWFLNDHMIILIYGLPG